MNGSLLAKRLDTTFNVIIFKNIRIRRPHGIGFVAQRVGMSGCVFIFYHSGHVDEIRIRNEKVADSKNSLSV